MNINGIQGTNAYTANALMADTTSVQNNNKEATGVEPVKESSQTRQEAFQVEITQQALRLQAESTKDLAPKNPNQQLSQQGRQGSQIDVTA